MKNLIIFISSICLLSCSMPQMTPVATEMHLPVPVTNNAVTLLRGQALSFAGLLSGKTWKDVTARSFACKIYDGNCQEIPPLPDGVGRLASVAVHVEGQAYILGGYTVAQDGTEVSTPDVWRFDLQTETYSGLAPIPVPVDDAVAGVYQHYIYLVSGWHDDDNVDLVQVFDTRENRWFQATPFPGSPVFGHAGAIAGRVGGSALVICGGVKVVPPVNEDARRTFEISNECWRGEIDAGNPASIDWSLIKDHPPALYRMAATGVEGQVIFAGGSDNPYNYDGMGYDGVPSEPSSQVWVYDAWHKKIYEGQNKPLASMDHRGLLHVGGQYLIMGGMGVDGEVLDGVQVLGIQESQ